MSPTWIQFGTIARAHGVRGELRIQPLDPDVDLPPTTSRVRARAASGDRVLTVTRVRPVHRAVLLSVEGIADRDAAQALAGSPLEVDADELPPAQEGEIYAYEIEGAEVVDENGEAVGRILRLVGTAAHDLVEIDTPNGVRLLPWVDHFIIAFDREARRLTVRLMDGLWG
jgi:16S rRNA processing protein RimM